MARARLTHYPTLPACRLLLLLLLLLLLPAAAAAACCFLFTCLLKFSVVPKRLILISILLGHQKSADILCEPAGGDSVSATILKTELEDILSTVAELRVKYGLER